MITDNKNGAGGDSTSVNEGSSIDPPDKTKAKSGPVESGVGFGGVGVLLYLAPWYLDFDGEIVGFIENLGIVIVVLGALVALTGVDLFRKLDRALFEKVLGFAILFGGIHFVSVLVPRPVEIALKLLNLFILLGAWVLVLGALGEAFKRRKFRIVGPQPITLRSGWKSLVSDGRDSVELAGALMVAGLNMLTAVFLVLQQML